MAGSVTPKSNFYEMRDTSRSVARASSQRVQKLYEEKIAALQDEREKLERRAGTEYEVEAEPLLGRGRALLENPLRYWQKGDLTQRRRAQLLVFETSIPFDREQGYRTAEFSLLYRLLGQSSKGKSSLVDLLKRDLNPVAEELRRWEIVLRGECPAA